MTKQEIKQDLDKVKELREQLFKITNKYCYTDYSVNDYTCNQIIDMIYNKMGKLELEGET